MKKIFSITDLKPCETYLKAKRASAWIRWVSTTSLAAAYWWALLAWVLGIEQTSLMVTIWLITGQWWGILFFGFIAPYFVGGVIELISIDVCLWWLDRRDMRSLAKTHLHAPLASN